MNCAPVATTTYRGAHICAVQLLFGLLPNRHVAQASPPVVSDNKGTTARPARPAWCVPSRAIRKAAQTLIWRARSKAQQPHATRNVTATATAVAVSNDRAQQGSGTCALRGSQPRGSQRRACMATSRLEAASRCTANRHVHTPRTWPGWSRCRALDATHAKATDRSKCMTLGSVFGPTRTEACVVESPVICLVHCASLFSFPGLSLCGFPASNPPSWPSRAFDVRHTEAAAGAHE